MPDSYFTYKDPDPINFAPFMQAEQQAKEFAWKQQQQPMIDALNRQKLQQGMLNMGSLEYTQRKKMEDDAQSRDAALMLQQSMLPNKDNTGLELDQASTFKAMLEKGINPKVAAEAMQFAGTGTGAISADKQANAIELLTQKLQATADNKAKSEDSKTNLLRLSETLSKGMYDPENTQREILTALEMTPEDQRSELLNTISKASEKQVPFWDKAAAYGLPIAGGIGGFMSPMPGGLAAGVLGGEALAQTLIGATGGSERGNSFTGNRDFNSELVADFISKLPKKSKK